MENYLKRPSGAKEWQPYSNAVYVEVIYNDSDKRTGYVRDFSWINRTTSDRLDKYIIFCRKLENPRQHRKNALMPRSDWHPFPPEAIVQVWNESGQSNVGRASKFWWGWSPNEYEGIITSARRLDVSKERKRK